jgi:hypothetical protein
MYDSSNALDSLVEATRYSHVFDLDEFAFTFSMAFDEEIIHPIIFLHVSDRAADFIACENELVNDMATNKTIGTGNKNGRANWDDRVFENYRRRHDTE